MSDEYIIKDCRCIGCDNLFRFKDYGQVEIVCPYCGAKNKNSDRMMSKSEWLDIMASEEKSD